MLNGLYGSDTNDDDILAARKSSLSDILSVFDPQALPEEYLHSLPEVSTEMPIDRLFVSGDLSATIYGLAIRDESIYDSLAEVVPPDLCARYYLRKQQGRAEAAIQDLDRFAQNGPTTNIELQGIDVEECGRTLRRIVCNICRDHESRVLNGGLEPNTKTMAPEILVEILEAVLKQNRDIYGENLYDYLIGEPPAATSSEENDDFVVDKLMQFPPRDWMHQTMVERLNDIAQSVRQKAPNSRHRSILYATKVKNLVNSYGGGSDVFEASSPPFPRPHRRPTFGEERESQRPRFG